jgi:hypothetical protein
MPQLVQDLGLACVYVAQYTDDGGAELVQVYVLYVLCSPFLQRRSTENNITLPYRLTMLIRCLTFVKDYLNTLLGLVVDPLLFSAIVIGVAVTTGL